MDKTDGLKAKVVDVARERAAIAKIAIRHDHEFPLRIGLISEAANRPTGQGKPITGCHSMIIAPAGFITTPAEKEVAAQWAESGLKPVPSGTGGGH